MGGSGGPEGGSGGPGGGSGGPGGGSGGPGGGSRDPRDPKEGHSLDKDGFLACFNSPGLRFGRDLVEMKRTLAPHIPIYPKHLEKNQKHPEYLKNLLS